MLVVLLEQLLMKKVFYGIWVDMLYSLIMHILLVYLIIFYHHLMIGIQKFVKHGYGCVVHLYLIHYNKIFIVYQNMKLFLVLKVYLKMNVVVHHFQNLLHLLIGWNNHLVEVYV